MQPLIPYASQADASIVDWCEENIILPSFTAKPGRLTLTKAQKGILEAYQKRECQELTAMMSSQIGKSLIILCIMSFHIGNNPRQIMFVEPDLDLLRRFNNEKLYPLLQSNSSLDDAVIKTRVGTLGPGIIQYTGGQIITATSGARNSLKQASIEVVLADEVDGYRVGTADSSSPLTMLRQRGATFEEDAKRAFVSTPIDESDSIIYDAWQRGTASLFKVPCPHCQIFQLLLFENIKEGVLYCVFCEEEITELDRRKMLELGYWEDTNKNPEKGKFSFHLSQLYNPFKTIAATWEDWNPEDVRGSTTQILGWPYDNKINEPIDFNHLGSLETEKDLDEIDAVVSGVDIQGNRIEANIMHCYGFHEKYHVKYHQVFYGKTDTDEPWIALKNFLSMHEPDMVFIDRGYRPSVVEHYCKTLLYYWWKERKIRIVKGLSRDSFNDYPIPVMKNSKKNYKSIARQFDLPIATDNVKVRLHSLVERSLITVDYTRTPQDFWDQFLSEELRRVVRGVKEVIKWVKIPNRRNEVLDCLVYGYCAREILGHDYRRGGRIGLSDIMRINSENSQ